MSSERVNNYTLNITSNNLNVSLISAGSIATLGATIATLYVNSITSANIYVSGSVVSVNVTSVNVIDTNITTGTLNATNMTTGTLNASTGITTATLNASTGITTGTLLATSSISSASLGTLGATVGTLYVTSITSGSAQLSGTISAATHVGTLISSGSLGTNGITAGSIYANNISSSNMQFSGTISAATHVGTLMSSGSLVTAGGITSGATILAKNGILITSGGLQIANSNLGAFKIITGTIGILALAANGTVSGSFLYNNNYYFSATPTVTLSVIGGSNSYYALASLNGYDASGGSFYVTNMNGSFTTQPTMSYIAVGPA